MKAFEIERRCLSALMKSAKDAYAAAAVGLKAEHFLGPEHRTIYNAIMMAASAVKETDLMAVWAQLQSFEGVSAVPLSLLTEIEGLEATSINRASYVAGVIAGERKRRLLVALAKATDAAKAEARSWDDLWVAVEPHLDAAQSTANRTTAAPINEVCDNVAKNIISPDSRKTQATGFPAWDKIAGALRAGEMVALAARPGCGKTALAVQIAVHAAAKGANAAFFSLEMSSEELVERMALLRAGRLGAGNQAVVLSELKKIATLKGLHIYDNRESHSLASIEARCRLLSAAPSGLDIVFIDYLQLIEPPDTKIPREQQVAQMSRRLKKLAGVCNCPVVILAQLNRESEKEERMPRMSDLRESGAIEQDSDRVWLLWHDKSTLPKMEEEPSEIQVALIQAKCRGGRPNIAAQMLFTRSCYHFSQITKQYERQ